MFRAFETVTASNQEAKSLGGLCQTACIGACCMKGNVLELTSTEAAYMARRGTGMIPVPREQMDGYKPPRGKAAFELQTDCANLDPETRACTDYENRPGICREFKACDDDLSPCQLTRTEIARRVTSGVVDLPMPVVPKFAHMVENLGQTS